jgi:hypothetical protein
VRPAESAYSGDRLALRVPGMRKPRPVPTGEVRESGRGSCHVDASATAPGALYTACKPSVPYESAVSNCGVPWPSLAARSVSIGGACVSYEEADRAVRVLSSSRTSAIAPVLRSAGSPLAGCDYRAAALPYLPASREAPKTGRSGAAGRHVVKNAFLAALACQMSAAFEAEMATAMEAFAVDERYAASIARDAVALRERAYVSGVRSSVRAAVARAVASCEEAAGVFTCDAATACGTGSCRFASACHSRVAAGAGPGRFTRPSNHARAGESFSDAEAASELASGTGRTRAVQVHDTDFMAA